MKLAYPLPHTKRLQALSQAWEREVDGPLQRRFAQHADALGYDTLSVPEHFVIPHEHVPLSGPHYFHSIAAQGVLAGATERIRIHSSLTILPLQHPIVTAKGLSTIDWMSGGRVTACFGVGWLEAEFAALGVPFRERGQISDEYLAAIVELWTSPSPCFEGRYVSFRDVAFEPKPVQSPHIPIWMGGDSDAALRRTARFACGWLPYLTRPEDLPARIDFIKSQPEFGGGPFEVMLALDTSRVGEGHAVIDDPGTRPGLPKQAIIDRLGWFADLGVTASAVPIPPLAAAEAYFDFAQWVMEEIKPAFG